MTLPTLIPGGSIRRQLFQVPLFLMDVLGINRLLRFITAGHVRVLMYHGVSDEPLGPDYWLMVPRSTFEWQMSYLHGRFQVCPWTCLLEPSTKKPGPSVPKVVITFDDAYANLSRNACPVLERLSFPAVCFVIPDLSERGEEIWNTKLFRLILESDVSRIAMGEVESGDLILPSDRVQRNAVARRFVNELKSQSPSEIRRVVDHIIRSCEPVHHSDIAREFELMSMGDIRKLRDAAHIAIGTHSNSHYSLSSLAAADQEAQIADSVACLSKHGIEPTAVFAFPSGHFNNETIHILRKHGFKVAFTTEEGLFHPYDDLLSVKRIAVGGDMTDLEFRAEVSGAGHFVTWMLGRRA